MLDIIGYVVLGIFLLIVPGFLFSLVLYPKRGSLDFWARIGVSLGLGLIILIYVAYLIARPEWKALQLTPFLGVTAGVCVALAIVAYIRGGAGVVLAYARAVVRFFHKPKPHHHPAHPQHEHEEHAAPKHEEKTPEQPPEKGRA